MLSIKAIQNWLATKRSLLFRKVRKSAQSLRKFIFAAAFLLYIAAFLILYPIIGDVVTCFTFLPVAAAAMLYGRKPAFWTSAAITVTTIVLFLLAGSPRSLLVILGSSMAGLIVLLILAWLASWNIEMREKMQQDMMRREVSERALRESEMRYRMLFNNINDTMLIHDLDGQVTKVNLAACDQLGYTAAQIVGLNIYRLAGTAAEKMKSQMAALQDSQKVLFETCLTTRTGETIPVEINATMIEYQGRTAVLSIARDIRQRKAIERSEQEQRALAETLRDIAADLTSTLELEEVMDRILFQLGRVIENDAVSIDLVDRGKARVMRHRGFTERGLGEWIDDTVRRVSDQPTLRIMAETRRPIVIPDTDQDPRWVFHPQTDWVRSYAGAPMQIKGETIGFLNVSRCEPGFFTPVHGERLQAIANHAAVAIQNARLYAEVQRLAMVDPLTGLYNRRGLFEFGQREVERARRYRCPLSALLVDVDHFKQYNDDHSYATGDCVLAEVARRCRDAVRKVDLVTRFGGDEFVILLSDCTLESAHIVADHVRAAICGALFDTDEGPLPVTVSIGIATISVDDPDLNQLIHDAGQAAHEAKESGRNRAAVAGSRLQ